MYCILALAQAGPFLQPFLGNQSLLVIIWAILQYDVFSIVAEWTSCAFILILLSIKWTLKWRYHSYNCYRGIVQMHSSQAWISHQEMMTEKVYVQASAEMMRVMVQLWRQGIPGPCSRHRKLSIAEHWATRCWNNQRHGVGGTKTLSSFHISSQLEQLGEVRWCSVVQAPVGQHAKPKPYLCTFKLM